jgi:hypothetical protein
MRPRKDRIRKARHRCALGFVGGVFPAKPRPRNPLSLMQQSIRLCSPLGCLASCALLTLALSLQPPARTDMAPRRSDAPHSPTNSICCTSHLLSQKTAAVPRNPLSLTGSHLIEGASRWSSAPCLAQRAIGQPSLLLISLSCSHPPSAVQPSLCPFFLAFPP